MVSSISSLQFFKEGLRSIFRQWTGLELAVFHQWGGPSSTDRAEALMEEVLGMFQGVDKIYKDVRYKSISTHWYYKYCKRCNIATCHRYYFLIVKLTYIELS